jgi:hypothetical protein
MISKIPVDIREVLLSRPLGGSIPSIPHFAGEKERRKGFLFNFQGAVGGRFPLKADPLLPDEVCWKIKS